MSRVVFALAAVLAGCSPCGSAECPVPQPLVEGSYVLTFQDARTGLADVTEDRVEITYTDDDGNTWRVVYDAGPVTE